MTFGFASYQGVGSSVIYYALIMSESNFAIDDDGKLVEA